MTRNRHGAAMQALLQHMPTHSDAGYETADDEFVAMHDGFLGSHEKFAEKVKANLIGCNLNLLNKATSKGGWGWGWLLDSDLGL